MSWDYFIYFAVGAVILWALGAYLAWREVKRGLCLFFFRNSGFPFLYHRDVG